MTNKPEPALPTEPRPSDPKRIWYCKIGETEAQLPHGADGPMREAVADAYTLLTGQKAEFIFSGWAGELTEAERAVVENREPRSEEPSRECLYQVR